MRSSQPHWGNDMETAKHNIKQKEMVVTHKNTHFYRRNCHKWPFVNVDSQISAILGGLEDYILRKKRRIYESLTTSVQSDLKPCYEGGRSRGRHVYVLWGLSVSNFSVLFFCSPLKVFVLLRPKSLSYS